MTSDENQDNIDTDEPEKRSRTLPSIDRARIEESADRAIEQFDEGIVDLLSWLLDTDTRARIYIFLRKYPHSTSEEIAKGTGLYPSTVRETLAELTNDEIVTREKRKSTGAGNNPYEYEAIPPSALVTGIKNQIQSQLNAVFNLDNHLRDEPSASEPITIEVEETDDPENDESK